MKRCVRRCRCHLRSHHIRHFARMGFDIFVGKGFLACPTRGAAVRYRPQTDAADRPR
jgi:hypothetical protein